MKLSLTNLPRTFEDAITDGGPFAKMLIAIKSAYEDFVCGASTVDCEAQMAKAAMTGAPVAEANEDLRLRVESLES